MWHKGREGDVEEGHRSVADSPGTERGYSIRLLPY